MDFSCVYFTISAQIEAFYLEHLNSIPCMLSDEVKKCGLCKLPSATNHRTSHETQCFRVSDEPRARTKQKLYSRNKLRKSTSIHDAIL